MKKKLFRHRVSFKKHSIAGNVSLRASGVSMPILTPEALIEYRQDFTQKDSLSLGAFGNDPKYYEHVGDIAPKPEDFIEVPFRLISATIVGGGTWKATDFSDVKMLKKSHKMLDGKPVYADHETDVHNWAGIVNGVKWTKAFTNDDGIQVPAGIDGILAIDKKTSPKLARGILLGAIYSNSVTVEFDWEMSHEFDDEWQFLNAIGTLGQDGKMIRRIAKTIYNYHESSLVWLGADPFAKAITPEGNLKNIDISSVYSYTKTSFGKNQKVDLVTPESLPQEVGDTKTWTVNFAVDKNVLSLAQRKKIVIQNNKDMNKFWLAFVAIYGDKLNLTAESPVPAEDEMGELLNKLSFVSAEDAQKATQALIVLNTVSAPALEIFKKSEGNAEATSVDMGAFMKSHSFIANTELTALGAVKDANVQLEADKKALELSVTNLTPDAELGKSYLGMKKKEAIRLYKKTVGEDKADASVIAIFENAGNDAVEGLLKQYTQSATHKFSGKCKSCGSGDFEFKSSLSTTEDSTEEMPLSVGVSADTIYKQKIQSSMNIGRPVEEQE